MLLAAALLLQFPVFSPLSASSATSTQATGRIAKSETLSADASLAPAAFAAGQPEAKPAVPASSTLAVADPQPASPVAVEPSPLVPVYSSPMTIAAEQKRQRREWLALSVAQHTTAAFDAWSTRLVLSSMGNAQEANPFLRPFAGNSSMYAAVQVAPVFFDFLSRRMMRSQYGWERHTWWLPQTLSAAVSLGSGIHNIGVYNSR